MRLLVRPLRPAVALLAAAVAACSGGNKASPADSGTDAGVVVVADSGPAGPIQCDPEGSPCTTGSGCCDNLSCQGGTCQPIATPTCTPYDGLCGAGLPPCCSPTPPSGGWPAGSVPPNLGCYFIDAGPAVGQSVCFIGGQVGDPCSASTWGCTNGLVCSNGSCEVVPNTGDTCPRDAGSCLPGDDCTGYVNDVYCCIDWIDMGEPGSTPDCCQAYENPDPCQNWGLDCNVTGQPGNTLPFPPNSYTCGEPGVFPPPGFPIAEDLEPYSSVCSSQSDCQPNAGDSAQPICGSFFTEGEFQLADGGIALGPSPVPVCVEACAKPDDCGSLAWDCVGGQCVPNYCYAQNDSSGDDIAAILSQAQPNAPVTANVDVLFQPCAHGGPNTVCLPQDDESWNTTTGICYRVGAPDAGGVGASCDPSGARSDLAGLCAAGTLCLKGTCLPWCDTGNQTLAPCAQNQQCVAVQGDLPSSTANANGTGVCTDDCNPYLPAAQNNCPQHSGQPPSLCKPSGTDNDLFPSPGLCVGGSTAPIDVGGSCSPFGWVDPCVSGAVCAPNKAGDGYACGQICDPQPSPGLPDAGASCPSGTACVPAGPPICEDDDNGPDADAGFTGYYDCYHIGVCL